MNNEELQIAQNKIDELRALTQERDAERDSLINMQDIALAEKDAEISELEKYGRNMALARERDNTLILGLQARLYRALRCVPTSTQMDDVESIEALRLHDEAKDAEIARLREALEKLARLGNGDNYGNSIENVIAQEALAKRREHDKHY